MKYNIQKIKKINETIIKSISILAYQNGVDLGEINFNQLEVKKYIRFILESGEFKDLNLKTLSNEIKNKELKYITKKMP